MAEETITYRLAAFEGPLDLLLQLIDKNKVSITDIPISLIFDQYMEYIEEAQRLDLEIACEFIVMASTLMYIKSKMLLPRDPEKEDPRKELADALQIYKDAKEKAEELKPLYAEYSGRLAKDNDDIPPEKGFPLGLNAGLLSDALHMMVLRLKQNTEVPITLVNPLIKRKIVPVEGQIEKILQKLTISGNCSFFYLLKDDTDKSELIASFMGILELIKTRRILFCDNEEEFSLLTRFTLNPDYVPESGTEDEVYQESEDSNADETR
ncbi:MAG: segregation/condensation protein A [Clostridia bacterium]|nr:segregation/condensation protein A [Clostridia bacterium]